MTEYQKPLPTPTYDTRAFWEGTKRHELLIQKCSDCGKRQFYPRGLCIACMSTNLDWVRSSGRGTVYSHTTVYRPPSPAFTPDVPYVIAIVEMEEGVRMMGNIVGSLPDQVKVGMPVTVVFEDVNETITLPKFRRQMTEDKGQKTKGKE